MLKPRKKNILLIVPFTYPYQAGGGLHALEFGSFLNEKGFKVQILTFNRNLNNSCKSKIAGVTINRIPYFNKGLLLKLLSLLWILPWSFIKIICSNTTIIYGGFTLAWEFLILFGRLINKEIIFRSTMFGEDDISSLLSYNQILYPIRKLALKNITKHWALTPSFTQSYKLIFGNNAKIIESSQGVNSEKYLPAGKNEKVALREKLGLPQDISVILSVGIVIKRKGYLKVYDELHKLPFPFVYIILGDYLLDGDHHLNTLQSEAEQVFSQGKAILGDKIVFPGFVNNVNEYMRASDIFLLSSVREGLPNALLQAMSCGMPVISRNLSGIEGYLINHQKNGLLFNDEKEIAENIILLYNNPNLGNELGENARKTITEVHTFDLVYSRFLPAI